MQFATLNCRLINQYYSLIDYYMPKHLVFFLSFVHLGKYHSSHNNYSNNISDILTSQQFKMTSTSTGDLAFFCLAQFQETFHRKLRPSLLSLSQIPSWPIENKKIQLKKIKVDHIQCIITPLRLNPIVKQLASNYVVHTVMKVFIQFDYESNLDSNI